MSTFTKITKEYDSTEVSDGWGADAWGSSPWGGLSGSDWTKLTKFADTWNKITKTTDIWTKIVKIEE